MVLTRVDATLVVIRSTVSNVVANNVCLLKCHAVEAQQNVIHCKMPLRNRKRRKESKGEEQTLKTKANSISIYDCFRSTSSYCIQHQRNDYFFLYSNVFYIQKANFFSIFFIRYRYGICAT